jgi:hypothetical protein
MSAGGEIPGLAPDDGGQRCTEPGELRRRGKDNRSRAALLKAEAASLDRGADQLEHEARLWDVADAAEDALGALRQQIAGLEAAEEGTLAAERQAQDKLREDKRHAARRKGEATRAENGSREAQDEAAVRLHKSELRVAQAESDLAAARLKHQAAETALEAHRADLRGGSAAYNRALEAGFNPGIAPRTSPLQIGLGRPEDMTEAERRLVAMYVIAAAKAGGSTTPESQAPARERRTTNAGFAAQDPSGFRMVRQGTSMIAVPPALMPSPGS